VVVDTNAQGNLALGIGGSLTTMITVLPSLTEEPRPNMSATTMCPVTGRQRSATTNRARALRHRFQRQLYLRQRDRGEHAWRWLALALARRSGRWALSLSRLPLSSSGTGARI
jgi:hypothetical protein